jgi:hypothetical protein
VLCCQQNVPAVVRAGLYRAQIYASAPHTNPVTRGWHCEAANPKLAEKMMNGKPKNHMALVLAAFHCTHPDLDGKDATLLAYLAVRSDHGIGTNSYPGNTNLGDALKLGDTATDERLAKNIERGLIVRTARAEGRSKASVYRLCLESPYYPDRLPGGKREWLIDNPPALNRADNEKPPAADRAHIANKPPALDRADNLETARPNEENRPEQNAKPPGLEAESARSRAATTRDSPETHQPPTLTFPQKKAGEGGEGADAQKQNQEKALWQEFTQGLGKIDDLRGTVPSTAEKTALLKQMGIYSVAKLLDAISTWAEERRPRIEGRDFGRMTCWLDECGPYLASKKTVNAQPGAGTGPAQEAYIAEINRAEEERRQERLRKYGKKEEPDGKVVSMGNPEEYLKDIRQ